MEARSEDIVATGKPTDTSPYATEEPAVGGKPRRRLDLPLPCTACDQSFDTADDLGKHREVCHRRGAARAALRQEFMCDECGGRFGSRVWLTLHKRRNHSKTEVEESGEQEQEGVEVQEERQTLPCPACGKVFVAGRSLKLHRKYCGAASGERAFGQMFPCDHCAKVLSSRRGLGEHVLRMHSTELGAARVAGRCAACGEEGLEGRLALRRHWRSCPKAKHKTSAGAIVAKVKEVVVTSVEETFICSKCDKTFCSRNGLQLHTRQYCGRMLSGHLARLVRAEARVEEKDSSRYAEENLVEKDEENNVDLG